MHVDVAKEVATLEVMSVSELRAKYAQVFGEETRAGNKRWLVRRIIWRLQALAEGDLSERARKRASELANDADLRLNPPKLASVVSPNKHSTPTTPKPDNRLPPAGQILRRLYKGRLVHVRILPKGFEFDGAVFQSLSAVAKVITGSHTNGFLFFKLLDQGGSQ